MTRVGWIDVAKGLGIVLVVIGHALGGMIDSAIAEDRQDFRALFFGIYTFHMPLFFLLAGLFVEQRLDKGAKAFVLGLGATIVWPYFLWSIIQFSAIFVAGSLVNSPATEYWKVILSLPWNTVSQFWFLYALFWLHCIAAVALPRIGREGLLLLALALKAAMLILALPVPVRLVCNNAFFYTVGVWLSVQGVESLIAQRPGWIKAIGLPAVGLFLIIATFAAVGRYGADIAFASASSPELANLAWRFPAMAAALFASAAFVGVSTMRPIAAQRWIAALGRASMPIFILHILFIAATRILLSRSGLVTDPWALAVILVLVGLVGPLIVERMSRKMGLNRLLGFG